MFESSNDIVLFILFSIRNMIKVHCIQSYSSSPSFSHSSKSSKCCLRCSTVYSLTSPCRIISSISTLPSTSTLPATAISANYFRLFTTINSTKENDIPVLVSECSTCNYESAPISGPEEIVLRFNACDWIP